MTTTQNLTPPLKAPHLSSEDKHLKLLLKDCAEGFYQHMFFLGKDVMSPRGNSLIKYGFTKSPSKGLKGTSCYTLSTPDQTIELYGSCACCYTPEGNVAFLRKTGRFYHWLPDHKCVAGLWDLSDVSVGTPQSLFKAIRPLLKWWVEYEKWATDELGTTHRQKSFKDWSQVKTQKPWLPPQEATLWVSSFLENASQQIRPKKFLKTLTV